MKQPKIISRVKEAMVNNKMTVVKMMELTGLSNETVMRARDHRIESCSIRTLAAIAAALGCKVVDLFREIEDQEKHQ